VPLPKPRRTIKSRFRRSRSSSPPSKTTSEIVLKDMHIEQVPRSTEIRIGEKAPPDIALQTFPPLVAEKVPQVRTYKFFLTENQIVVVSPQNIIADIIK